VYFVALLLVYRQYGYGYEYVCARISVAR